MKYLTLLMMAASLAACETAPPPPLEPTPPPIVVNPPVTQDSQTGALNVPMDENVRLPPPNPGPVTLQLRRADNGKTFNLRVGQTLSVSLVGVETAGFAWRAPNTPPILHLNGQTTGPTSTDQIRATGESTGAGAGPRWEVTTFETRAAGTATLVFEQHRGGQIDAWSATIVVN